MLNLHVSKEIVSWRKSVSDGMPPYKVQLIPRMFFSLMKLTSFPNYFSENIFSINNIPAILQAFEVIIFCPKTEHSGIWIGLHVTSSKDKAQNTQEKFDWGSGEERGLVSRTAAGNRA